jgi:hypothetical protein
MVTIPSTPLARPAARIAAAVLGSLAAGGCTQLEKIDDDGGSGGAGIPDVVQRAFDESCSFAGCHDSAARAGGLDLSAAAAPGIIGGMSTQSDLPLVEIGNVQGSYLALKLLSNPPVGLQMPPGVTPGANSAIILGWIAGAPLPSGGGGGGGNTTDAGGESTDEAGQSTGDPGVRLCGIENVAPSAPNPFDIGPNAGQIPPDVGEALVSNCGCHEVDPTDVVAAGAFPYAGAVHFSTLAEVRAEYLDPPRTGVEILLERMQSTEGNRMPPPYYCDLGDGSVITEADRQLLVDWLTAGAPDTPSWIP